MLSKSDIDTHFDSPEGLIEEASEGIGTLARILSEFPSANKPAFVRESEAKTGNQIFKICFPTPSKIIRRKVYRVVTDARSALDQAVHAATICFDGKTHGTKTYFPFAQNPDDFDIQFIGKHGRTKDATPRIADVIKGFQPWWTGPGHAGGNDVLRFLGKISGPNKHQVGLTAIPDFHSHWIQSLRFSKLIRFPDIPERIRGTNDFLFAVAPPNASVEYYGSLTYGIGLSETHPNVPRDAIIALGAMLAIARNLIISIKNVAIRDLT